MPESELLCPWCQTDLSDSVPQPAKEHCHPKIFGFVTAEYVLDHKQGKTHFFQCNHPLCWAPTEGVLCQGRDQADKLRRIMSKGTWCSPQAIRLPRKLSGGRDDIFAVLFNYEPLKRWLEIRLSQLVDVEIISKFLSAYAYRFKNPVTLFEAWASDVGPKGVYWIPVQPLGALNPNTAPHYRNTCFGCRKVFKDVVENVFQKRSDKWSRCPHYGQCPAQHACERPASGENAYRLNRCLIRLECQEAISPCYMSDLSILNSMAEEFRKKAAGDWIPYCSNCWAGYEERAYPVVVHGHLVGAVMTGQFQTAESPKSGRDFIEREERFCKLNGTAPRLGSLEERLDHALEKDMKAQPDQECTQENASSNITGDVKSLVELAQGRYQRHRHLVESTFRLEVGGTLDVALFHDKEFGDFLPSLLDRMCQFWAFEHVILCLAHDADMEYRLEATEKAYVGQTLDTLDGFDVSALADEFGTRAVLFVDDQLVEPSDDTQSWRAVFRKLETRGIGSESTWHKQVFVVIVRAGDRVYTFFMLGRNPELTSRLPVKWKHNIKLSKECRTQVVKTCEQVARSLQNFWAHHDHEMLYRTLSHTLRTPIDLMRAGLGSTRQRLSIHKNAFRKQFPTLCENVETLVQSLRLGSEVVDQQLTSMAGAANLPALLKDIKNDTTDLADRLPRFEKQYRWLSQSAFTDRQTVAWTFDFPRDSTEVVGAAGPIELAIRNVLENAMKYSYPGRTIEVRLETVDAEAILSVASEGVPVDEEERERVWQRDFRGAHARRRKSRAAEGTGYGLFLVREILDAVGGSVSLESHLLYSYGRPLTYRDDLVGKTTVVLRFPLAKRTDERGG